MWNRSARLLETEQVAPGGRDDRRAESRLRTVYRVAGVTANGDRGLARLLNISDSGMMLSVSLDVRLGDWMYVDLGEGDSLEAKVVWYDGQRCGVKLRSAIDSGEKLKQLCEERRSGSGRPLRVPLCKPAMASSEQGLHLVKLQDISQGGLNVIHDGRFKEGLSVKVCISPGIDRRGVVRWVRDDRAGIALYDVLTVEELGSMNRL